jgi:hypothetical protein
MSSPCLKFFVASVIPVTSTAMKDVATAPNSVGMNNPDNEVRNAPELTAVSPVRNHC